MRHQQTSGASQTCFLHRTLAEPNMAESSIKVDSD